MASLFENPVENIILFGIYVVTFLMAILVMRIVWSFRQEILGLVRPSYYDLVAQKELLHQCVAHWRYTDGSYVPQHKRQRMFRDLRRLSQKIRNHPDNPDSKLPKEESLQESLD